MTSKTIDLPNGDRATIQPQSMSKVREALKSLAKQGIRVVATDADLLNNLEFTLALGRAVIIRYESKQGEEYKELSDQERNKFLEQRPKVTGWLVRRSKEFGDEEDKEFEEDIKNS